MFYCDYCEIFKSTCFEEYLQMVPYEISTVFHWKSPEKKNGEQWHFRKIYYFFRTVIVRRFLLFQKTVSGRQCFSKQLFFSALQDDQIINWGHYLQRCTFIEPFWVNILQLKLLTTFPQTFHFGLDVSQGLKYASDKPLTLLWRRSLSYKTQSINMQSKSINWFLYDWDLLHESAKRVTIVLTTAMSSLL